MFKQLLKSFDIKGILKMKLYWELSESTSEDSKSQGGGKAGDLEHPCWAQLPPSVAIQKLKAGVSDFRVFKKI